MFFHLKKSQFLEHVRGIYLSRQTGKVHVQISVYTNVPHTVHVLFILSKISEDILRTCLRTFEADILKIFEN